MHQHLHLLINFSVSFFFCGISLKSFDLWYHRERIHSAVDYIYDCNVYDIAIWMIYKMTYIKPKLSVYSLLGGFFLVIKHGDWYCCMHFLKDRFQFEYFCLSSFFNLLYIIICCSFYILIYISHSYLRNPISIHLYSFPILTPVVWHIMFDMNVTILLSNLHVVDWLVYCKLWPSFWLAL